MEIISTGGGKDIPEMSLSAPEQKHFSRNSTEKKDESRRKGKERRKRGRVAEKNEIVGGGGGLGNRERMHR